MNNEDIKNMFDKIQTPEYDPAIIKNEVDKKINQGYKTKPRISRRKRAVIIAAAVMAMLFMMGMGEYLMRITVFDADGNRDIWQGPLWQRLRQPSNDEQAVFEREEYYANNENLLLVITFAEPGVTGKTNPQRSIYDYDELQKFTDGEIFKLPQYIPEGFEFTSATVTFFIGEDFDYENTEPVYREEKFGNIYEKYYIPENPAHLEIISVSYKKDDANFYIYNNRLGDIPADEVRYVSFAPDSKYEKLNMPEYYNAVMLTEIWNRGIIYSFHAVSPVPPKQEYYNQRNITVNYNINPSDMPRGEIIKIAESIK